ncbi:hypothetical protein ACFPRL_12670 [Pseudoclavibacter helvolus]
MMGGCVMPARVPPASGSCLDAGGTMPRLRAQSKMRRRRLVSARSTSSSPRPESTVRSA